MEGFRRWGETLHSLKPYTLNPKLYRNNHGWHG
jgi:hypothetical protein